MSTGVDQAEQQAAADGPVAELLDAQERLGGAALADREGARPRRPAPPMPSVCAEVQPASVGLGDRVDDRGEAAGGERGAAEVEPRQRGCSVSAGTILRAARRAPAATGRLTKKISRQSTSSVSTPPRRTPSAAPAPPTAPQAASALARAGRGSCW